MYWRNFGRQWLRQPVDYWIVITAHIDSKKGSPGAIDNATGVVVLLLLATLLKNYSGEKLIEQENPGPRVITAFFFSMAGRQLQYPQNGLLKISIPGILHTPRKTISGLLIVISLLNWLPH